MSRFVPAATVVDGLVAPQLSFFEDDLGGFRSQPTAATSPPLLPGTSRHISFDAEAWTLAEYAAELSRASPPDGWPAAAVTCPG